MVLIKMDSSLTDQAGEDFEITFGGGLKLDPKKEYEIALLKASIWYSYYNVSSTYSNNTLRYSADGGSTFNNVVFDNGIYGIGDLNRVLNEKMKANGDYSVVNGVDTFNISILPNFQTLKVKVTVSNNYQLDLTTSSLRELLGFSSTIVTTTQEGTELADITRGVSSLVLKLSIVSGNSSFSNGTASNIIFSFVPNVSPGSINSIDVPYPIYVDINTRNYIDHMRFNLVDNQDRPVYLNGEHVFLLFDLREKK